MELGKSGRVVITGLGVVGGKISGAAQMAEMLRESTMLSSEVDRSAGYHLPESSRLAVLSDGAGLKSWLAVGEGRRMSLPSKLAVAAARMALNDARLPSVAGPRTTVVISSGFGAVEVTENLLRAVFTEGPETVSPFIFTESVANAAAAQIAIATQARGPNLTISQREAGILTAVGRGAAEIEAGRADCALVGGVEEMAPILHALLDRLRSLARPGDSGGEVARPFDRRRNGFVAAEGAVVLVLESEENAKSRGADFRGVIRGFGSAFDATAPRVGWGRGHESLARSLRGLLGRTGLGPGDVGQIVSGASGAITGDRLEAHTLRAVWGDRLPPILAPKGVTGQYGGGFLAAAVLAASNQPFGPAAGFRELDRELGVTPHQDGPIPSAAVTLVTSLASGGSASWLVLERPQ